MENKTILPSVGVNKKKCFIKAEATAEWLKTQKNDNREEVRAVIVEHAYHALEPARVTRNNLDAASLHSTLVFPVS